MSHDQLSSSHRHGGSLHHRITRRASHVTRNTSRPAAAVPTHARHGAVPLVSRVVWVAGQVAGHVVGAVRHAVAAGDVGVQVGAGVAPVGGRRREDRRCNTESQSVRQSVSQRGRQHAHARGHRVAYPALRRRQPPGRQAGRQAGGSRLRSAQTRRSVWRGEVWRVM